MATDSVPTLVIAVTARYLQQQQEFYIVTNKTHNSEEIRNKNSRIGKEKAQIKTEKGQSDTIKKNK